MEAHHRSEIVITEGWNGEVIFLMVKKTALGVRFEPDEHDALAKAAAADGRPSSSFARKVLTERLRKEGWLNALSPKARSTKPETEVRRIQNRIQHVIQADANVALTPRVTREAGPAHMLLMEAIGLGRRDGMAGQHLSAMCSARNEIEDLREALKMIARGQGDPQMVAQQTLDKADAE